MAAVPPRFRRYPLYLYLALLFSSLVLVAGGALAWLGYVQGRNLALTAAEDTFRYIGRETQAHLTAALAPVTDLAEILARHPLAHARTPGERLAALPALRVALRSHAPLAAVYVGYDDGAFLLARPLADESARRFFEAPPQATLLAQEISVRAGSRRMTWIYFDDALREVGRREGEPDSFDPRTRPWYRLATEPGRRILTEPYVFFATGTPGVTVALRTASASVVGIDVALAGVSRTLAAARALPSMEIALFDEERRVLAVSDSRLRVVRTAGTTLALARLEELEEPVLAALAPAGSATPTASTVAAGGRDWQTMVLPVATARGPLHLGLAVPLEDLLAPARAIRTRSLLAALLVLALALPVTWLISRYVARSLNDLTREARDIDAFRFDGPAAPPSPIIEIDQLAGAMNRMRETIRRFLDIAGSLSAETHFGRLRDRVVCETAEATGMAAGLIYLLHEAERALEPGGIVRTDGSAVPGELAKLSIEGDSPVAAALRGTQAVVTVLPTDGALPGLPAPDTLWPGTATTLVALPLNDRAGEPLGVLVLLAPGEQPPAAERLAFARALSANAAIALETQRLLEARKALLESFIRLIASAIDAKSPYTGGHCERVPELTLMLARAACDATQGPYREFRLSDDEWEALQIASWLHDCGKVTTPEYVVDKATRLETLYDRIHEVRTRFEVLKRDAEIAYWRALGEGGDRSTLANELAGTLAALDEEFAFVAQCNEGGEALPAAHVERLRQIGRRTWLRTLDDRLGVSHEERARMERTPARSLPVVEALLADRPEHVIERGPADLLPPGGFTMPVPPLKYDRGELHNLTVSRGTLTAEERYVINHHIVQTIVMLTQLPFPRHLRNVPELAGGHHEKMDGTGYPKGLRREEMSVPARMMAIADIFEALTAVDRPYKRGKTLSESVRIMSRMSRDGHIDPDLFALFLRSGVHRRYAEQFLRPEQIDAVDVEAALAAA